MLIKSCQFLHSWFFFFFFFVIPLAMVSVGYFSASNVYLEETLLVTRNKSLNRKTKNVKIEEAKNVAWLILVKRKWITKERIVHRQTKDLGLQYWGILNGQEETVIVWNWNQVWWWQRGNAKLNPKTKLNWNYLKNENQENITKTTKTSLLRPKKRYS